MKKVAIIIPARLKSSRLEEKVLIDLKGKTMLQRVFERVSLAQVGQIYIATDSEKIKKIALKFTQNVRMTSSSHESGTDRIAEVASKIDYDYIINVQADEPFVDTSLIVKIAKKLQQEESEFITAAYPLRVKAEILDTSKVKVVLNKQSKALYFSRSPIPYSESLQAQYYCHIGIYGYSKNFLLNYVNLPFSLLEKSEKLEQLRALEAGHLISVIVTNKPSFGIDTAKDLEESLRFFVD